MDERELRALARAYQRGDQKSFRALVEALSRTLMAMAFRYTNDWEWARDLSQETWIRVHQSIQRYDPDRSFSSWLYAVHRNGCLDHLRKPWVRHESTPGDESVARWAGPAPEDPSQDLERREFHERIVAASDQLSETQRQIFARVDLEQGDQREVALELGIRPGTLRTTLHFARKRVAAVLREMEKST